MAAALELLVRLTPSSSSSSSSSTDTADDFVSAPFRLSSSIPEGKSSPVIIVQIKTKKKCFLSYVFGGLGAAEFSPQITTTNEPVNDKE